MTGLSEQVRIPTENLLVPDLLRRLCWDGVRSGDLARAEAVDEYLRAGGARAWQRELVVPRLVAAFGSS